MYLNFGNPSSNFYSVDGGRIVVRSSVLEVAAGTVNDVLPSALNAVRQLTLEIRIVLGAAHRDLHGGGLVENVATLGGAQAVTDADRAVATLGGQHDADSLALAGSDKLIDGVVIVHKDE